MIEQINNELLKLQEELTKFDGAVSQISNAGKVSEELIASTKELHKGFGEQLEKIEGLFSDYMNKTYTHTEDKLNNVFQKFQERLKQEEISLEKFSQLTMQNESLTQEFLQKITANSTEQVNKLINESSNTLNEEKDFIKLQINNFRKDIDKLIQEHKDTLKKEQELLDNYLELANETAQITATLKKVDFPKRLNDISGQIDVLKKNLNENTQKIAKLSDKNSEILNNTSTLLKDKTTTKILDKLIKASPRTELLIKNTTKTDRKVSSTRFFVILIFVLMLVFVLFSVYVLLNIYPNFFTDIAG